MHLINIPKIKVMIDSIVLRSKFSIHVFASIMLNQGEV